MYVCNYPQFSPASCHVVLQSSEIERMSTWYNPLGSIELAISNEDVLTTWRNTPVTDTTYKEMVRVAWDISPVLAIMLPMRCVLSQTYTKRTVPAKFLEYFTKWHIFGPVWHSFHRLVGLP